MQKQALAISIRQGLRGVQWCSEESTFVYTTAVISIQSVASPGSSAIECCRVRKNGDGQLMRQDDKVPCVSFGPRRVLA